MKLFLVLAIGSLPVLFTSHLLAQSDQTAFPCAYDLRFFDDTKDQEITITQFLLAGPDEPTAQRMYTQLRPYPNTFTATEAWFDRLAKQFCRVNEYALTSILVRKSEEEVGKYEVLLNYQEDPDIR